MAWLFFQCFCSNLLLAQYSYSRISANLHVPYYYNNRNRACIHTCTYTHCTCVYTENVKLNEMSLSSIFRSQRAFICNHDSHWLTVRKLGHQVHVHTCICIYILYIPVHVLSNNFCVFISSLCTVVQSEFSSEETGTHIRYISQPLLAPVENGRSVTDMANILGCCLV